MTKEIISSKDLHLYYGKKEALKGIDLSFNQGEITAMIGPSGCGKSTYLRSLNRMNDLIPNVTITGSVLYKDKDIYGPKTDVVELRKEIGMVPQEAVLFSGTIESNLRWAKQEASGEELRKALRVAQALDFVEKLPDGLRSPVNQGGKNFSGGQKQRLTIARALVGDPQILILDDSSSALDFATDAALRRAIRQETQNMTVLIVTQRASAIKQADKIIVLDDGAVVGIGNHRDLLESCEVYREICLSQLNKEEVESA